jgi:hypothetical protein
MGVKIDLLPAALALNGTDEFPINVGGVTKKGTVNQLAAFASGGAIINTFASRPGPTIPGKIFQPSDGYCDFVTNAAGNLWLPKFQGVIGTPPPAAASLVAVNTPSGMTFQDDKGTLLCKQNSVTGANLGLIRLSAYPSTPFHLRIGFAFNCIPANTTGWGVFLRDSVTGRIQTHFKLFDVSAVKWEVNNYSNPTTFAANLIADSFPGYSNLERGFIHFIDPGGTGALIIGQSADGDKNGYALCENTIGRTSYTATPDQFGIVLYTGNGSISRGNLSLRIFDWSYL